MKSYPLLQWLQDHVGFENYQHIGPRSLDRIRPFFEHLVKSSHDKNIKIVTIAGTNGKGQTCYAISEILNFFHEPYAMFLSPHVHSISERFQHENGAFLEQDIYQCFIDLKKRCDDFKITLSFFEFLFASFLHLSLQRDCKYLILEVGVGGRLDATNLLDAQVSVITSIGRDHQELLGTRLEDIFYEKFGITRTKAKLITFFDSKYLRNIANVASAEKNVYHIDLGFQHQHFGRKIPFSERNKMMALKATKNLAPHLPWSDFDETQFLVNRRVLPGRGEELQYQQNSKFYFYGSHNVDGMRAWFLQDLEYNPDLFYDLVLVGFSKRNLQDILTMMKQWKRAHQLSPNRYKKVAFTSFSHSKAYVPIPFEIEQIKRVVADFNQTLFWLTHWKDYELFLRIEGKINILVIGSFYFVSEVKSSLI